MQVVAVNSNQLDAKLGKAGSGFKEQVERLAKQISEVAEGMPQHVARRLASIVQGIFANPKGAMTASIAAGAIAQAHGIVLIDRFDLTPTARTTRSVIQDVNNLSLGYVLVARPFSVDSTVQLEVLKVRGNFVSAAGNFREPTDNIRKLTFMVYEAGGDGKPVDALTPLTFTRFDSNQINVVGTGGLTDPQGYRIDDFVMSFTNSEQLQPGNYFGVIVSEGSRVTGGSGQGGLRVANTHTNLGSFNNSYESWSTINNGAWEFSQDNGNGLISDMYLTGNPVPEPAGLIGLGAGLAFLIRKRRDR